MFDLVVLDLNMPIADGYEACTNILQLFQQDTLLNQSSSSCKSPSSPPLSKKPPLHGKGKTVKKQEVNKVMFKEYLPHMVALTAHIDEQVKV